MTRSFAFDNSYARLPGQMFARVAPTPVAAPRMLAFNDGLARDLGLDPEVLRDRADWFSGNAPPPGSDPIAQAYSGHQFGSWNPNLGDGRAILLGEVVAPDGRRFDIQLKGAGRTPYSRNGDGRAWLGPVLREYLVSEAMAALGVPTTRALAAVATGEMIQRETALPGAVLTRVAGSHIRVGTFQHYAARGDLAGLQALTDHVIARHYPEAVGPLDLFAAVLARHADLVARWLGLGFIHGVMNTDNVAISGETIDYGPCAFLDGYHPARVFSSIDRRGRYAYGAQPRVAMWNMAQFATALVPLFPDQDQAIEALTEVLNRFPDLHDAAWERVFSAKLGLSPGAPGLRALAEDLLDLMAAGESDFTLTFAGLADGTARDRILDRTAFDAWAARWRALAPDAALMARSNPLVIPRTHLIEAAITAAREDDLGPFRAMLAAVTRPFAPDAAHMAAPLEEERVTRTYCGT